MTKSYVTQQLPVVDDPDLVLWCVSTQSMRSKVVALLRGAISLLSERPLTAPTSAALAILNRITEASLSAEVLCSTNRVRDAAILILSIHELRLDLQYVSQDSTRAGTWLRHAQEQRKPWRVASQIRDLYSSSGDRAAEQAVYRQYSMAKHGNPVGGTFAFPIVATAKALEVPLATQNSPLVQTHMFALSTHLHAGACAAGELFRGGGLDVDEYIAGVEETYRGISEQQDQYVLSWLQAHLDTQADSSEP